jgi:hypothetical protein
MRGDRTAGVSIQPRYGTRHRIPAMQALTAIAARAAALLADLL